MRVLAKRQRIHASSSVPFNRCYVYCSNKRPEIEQIKQGTYSISAPVGQDMHEGWVPPRSPVPTAPDPDKYAGSRHSCRSLTSEYAT